MALYLHIILPQENVRSSKVMRSRILIPKRKHSFYQAKKEGASGVPFGSVRYLLRNQRNYSCFRTRYQTETLLHIYFEENQKLELLILKLVNTHMRRSPILKKAISRTLRILSKTNSSLARKSSSTVS